MAIGETNTFVVPSAAKSIALSRIDYNDTHKTIMQAFYSDAIPDSENIIIEGVQTTPLNGTLFRSSLTGRLYVRDSKFEKGNPQYGANWTRNGIGVFVEQSLALLDIDTYEIGELFVTVGSNARVYMKSTNAGAFVDVGLPLTNSITEVMVIDSAITSAKIANATISNIDLVASTVQGDKIAANTISNTNIIFDIITSDRIANNHITTEKINDSAVTTAKINDNAVTSTKILNNTIDTQDIATAAITTAEIEDNAVTIDKIADALLIEGISGHIDDPEIDTYNIDLDAKYPYEINEVTVKSQAGSGTLTILINGTPVTGISAVAFNTSENTYTATAAKSVATGVDVLFRIDTNSSGDDVMFTIKVTRTG